VIEFPSVDDNLPVLNTSKVHLRPLSQTAVTWHKAGVCVSVVYYTVIITLLINASSLYAFSTLTLLIEHSEEFVSNIAIFVLKRDVKLQTTIHQEEHPACKKNLSVVVCLEQGANDLLMVQLMTMSPLHLVSLKSRSV